MPLRLSSQMFKFVIALVMLVGWQAWAQTTPLSLQTASTLQVSISTTYFLDATGQKTVDEIEQLPAAEFAPFSPDKPIAIKGGALWLRFSAVSQTYQQGWRLTLPMATVDDVALFNRNAEGAWIKQVGGDTRPISSWAQPGRYPSFVLSDERQRSVDYWLQVRHERGLFSTLPRIVNESAFITSRQNEHLVLGMYFGLAILVVILALTRALVYRDTGFASYAVYVACLALLIATVSGISALYLWPQRPISTIMSPVVAALTVVAADWFVRVVTRPKRFSRWLDRALLGMMCITPCVVLLTIVQPSGTAYTIYSAVVLTNTLVLLSVIVGALWQGDHDSRWVALGFFPIVLAAFLPLLRNFGLIPAGPLTELAIPVASALEVVILFYGLHRRVSQPRSVATRVTRLLQIDPLTGLHTRQVLLKKLSSAVSDARRKKHPYALLVIQLTNAGAIEAKLGREAAERALVTVASCIRSIATSGDLLARVGDNQFALLLESPVTPLAANAAATQVLAHALRSASSLPEGQTLQLHIALGYPNTPAKSTAQDTPTILSGLLAAASEMRDDSRKTIRTVSVP